MALPSLERVLAYENPAVLKLYRQNHPNPALPAEAAFQEVLKYLWLTQKHAHDVQTNPGDPSLPRNCIMLCSMQEIDDMWHEFILFTEDYTAFCQGTFGRYIHHLPNIFENSPRPREEETAEIARLLPYIFDHLGEATLRTWFAPYLAAAG
ncbi:MAG TPA: hypothetical protein VFH51_13395 [Myxococcota bacterium]|nr:hypothetical protein [Myxococcota bacterium]